MDGPESNPEFVSDERPDPNSETDLFEKFTHAFIVKIWLEETGNKDQSLLWRGHITHAYTGNRKYFQDLMDILDFITAYLAASLDTASPVEEPEPENG